VRTAVTIKMFTVDWHLDFVFNEAFAAHQVSPLIMMTLHVNS